VTVRGASGSAVRSVTIAPEGPLAGAEALSMIGAPPRPAATSAMAAPKACIDG
jgi:hypothetical protein